MQHNPALALLGGLAFAALHPVSAQEPATTPRITGILADASGVELQWTGGTGSYQIQSRETVDGVWRNVGAPTESTRASLPASGRSAFYRVVSDFGARYTVTFNATWSQATHPQGWIASAHWSTMVGGVHDDSVHFWRDGETASPGVELMAERGNPSTLAAEIGAGLGSGRVLAVIQDLRGGFTSPGVRNLQYAASGGESFPTDRDHPRVTLCSMVAPSPDWFVGVDSLSLLDEQGGWRDSVTVDLFPRDAGTDDGVTFDSPDVEAAPHGVVHPLTGFPVLNHGALVPFGSFTFRRER